MDDARRASGIFIRAGVDRASDGERVAFLDSLGRGFDEVGRPPMSLIMLGIDGFAQLACVEGRHVARHALAWIASAARACTRPGDVVHRVDVDQLAVVVRRRHDAQAEGLIVRVRRAVGAAHGRDDAIAALPIPLVVGFAHASEAASATELCVLAESRMHEQKLRAILPVRQAG